MEITISQSVFGSRGQERDCNQYLKKLIAPTLSS